MNLLKKHRKNSKKSKIFFNKNLFLKPIVNFIKKSTRPSQENPNGGIVEKEASLHVSNVLVVQGGDTSRLGFKILGDGSKVRILKKTNEESEIQ